MSKNNHSECKKETRWYQTCQHIWDLARQVNAKLKLEKGLNYKVSDLLDDLIRDKHREVFPDVSQK